MIWTSCTGNPDLPDAGGGVCCPGAAMFGPSRCTCWTATYDLEQADPVVAAPVERAEPCADCAYRVGSPERGNEDDHAHGEDGLRDLIVSGAPFYCHDGIRRPLYYLHRPGLSYEEGEPRDVWRIVDIDELPDASGRTVVRGHPASYNPPIVDGVPYRADGQPAFLCAGWAQRRRLYVDTGNVL